MTGAQTVDVDACQIAATSLTGGPLCSSCYLFSVRLLKRPLRYNMEPPFSCIMELFELFMLLQNALSTASSVYGRRELTLLPRYYTRRHNNRILHGFLCDTDKFVYRAALVSSSPLLPIVS